MSGMLEPSFLLELGAYAVAVAGIRLFKHRLNRVRQPDAQNQFIEAQVVRTARMSSTYTEGILIASAWAMPSSKSMLVCCLSVCHIFLL